MGEGIMLMGEGGQPSDAHALLKRPMAGFLSGLDLQRYPCTWPGCTKEYTTSGNLNQHVASAHNGTRFRCSVKWCGKTYTRAIKLNKHEATAHPGELFACPRPRCRKAFGSDAQLAAHIREQHSRALFVCPRHGCGKMYVSRNSLFQHFLLHHEGQAVALARTEPQRSLPAELNFGQGAPRAGLDEQRRPDAPRAGEGALAPSELRAPAAEPCACAQPHSMAALSPTGCSQPACAACVHAAPGRAFGAHALPHIEGIAHVPGGTCEPPERTSPTHTLPPTPDASAADDERVRRAAGCAESSAVGTSILAAVPPPPSYAAASVPSRPGDFGAFGRAPMPAVQPVEPCDSAQLAAARPPHCGAAFGCAQDKDAVRAALLHVPPELSASALAPELCSFGASCGPPSQPRAAYCGPPQQQSAWPGGTYAWPGPLSAQHAGMHPHNAPSYERPPPYYTSPPADWAAGPAHDGVGAHPTFVCAAGAPAPCFGPPPGACPASTCWIPPHTASAAPVERPNAYTFTWGPAPPPSSFVYVQTLVPGPMACAAGCTHTQPSSSAYEAPPWAPWLAPPRSHSDGWH
ncbi:hypothetical protein KFE25_012520 [Diacronema lutheri]|uniref:C2H2-type domain-containing protein n=1 Tax=Diacronema lutheri TaxID=2081491 RepID=A0A8J6C878_DIALT|nr:hypothetical protein KFE25_012520 [Diacronema lutheri]